MSDANAGFEIFDRRANRYVKTPELTIQAGGSISVNAAAHKALGEPKAIELLYNASKKLIGLRAVAEEAAHAYPLRGVGKGGTGQTYVASPRAFFAHYEIPLGTPVRREVKMEGNILIVDLNDPGRVAISNRNRAKVRESHPAAEGDAVLTIRSPDQKTPTTQSSD
jgi:hypothetical protein